MEFLWSLVGRGFDSWNTTYRIEEFSAHVPGFVNLSPNQQKEVVTNLDTKDIQDLNLVWTIRDKVDRLSGVTSTDFIETFILNPNATDTLLPSFVPTKAELCVLHKQEVVFTQSMFMLIPSTIALLILMFLKPRKNLWPKFLSGRPSLVVPVNFIDGHGRRWAHCGAFAVMTSFLISFYNQQFFWNPGNWSDAEWALRFSWIKPIILLGNVVHLGYLFYPLFACLSLRRFLPANILGLTYALSWVYIDVRHMIDCPIERNRWTEELSYSKEHISRIVNSIPVFLGEIAVVFAFILDLGINSYKYHLKRSNQPNKYKRLDDKESSSLQYIKYLMTAHKEKPRTLKGKIKEMFVYTNAIGFKYPPRVVCTMCVAFVLLLSITITFGTMLDQAMISLQGFIFQLVSAKSGDRSNSEAQYEVIKQIPRYVSGIRGSIIFGNVVASLVHFGSMLHMIRMYRTHVRMVMRGDHSWHYDFVNDPPSKLVYGMRYSGYQIAYLLWGYTIMFTLVSIISATLTVLMIVPLTYGKRPYFLDQIIMMISTVVVTLLINRAQILMAKFGFLQERGTHLALTNRQAYHILSYFLFFFNIVVGAFSVLKRSLLSAFFGTLLLCRLDRCLLMQGFEQFDKGFSAYMGMLVVDATHNHPVLKGFIYILETEVKHSKERQKKRHDGDAEEGVDGKPTRRIDKRIRNKWWKLITLVNNPVLVIERLQKKVKEEREKKHDTRDDVVETIATTGAVLMRGVALGVESGVDNIGEMIVSATDIGSIHV